MNKSSFDTISKLAEKSIPFSFFISYDKKNILVFTLDEMKDSGIHFNICENSSQIESNIKPSINKIEAVSKKQFDISYKLVQKHLKQGNSYLLNLTFKTPIELNCSLLDVYAHSNAKYKAYISGEFTFFSPETFIQISKKGKIQTFPMKGTSLVKDDKDGSKLKQSIKERSEHNTIVDLLRNDLAIVAKNIKLDKFAYLEKIHTGRGEELWQMSSMISAQLNSNWKNKLGDILQKMLPAGSICGAPKEKTLAIIKDAENHNRGFYTGIAGYFDGNSLDSCIMIRFIKEKNNKHYYYSGGGITHLSESEMEYNEYLEKIYLPVI